MKHFAKRLALLSVSSLVINACSQHQEMQQLQADYQHYTTSSYVQDNLKAQSTPSSTLATKPQAAKISQQMHAVQQKLLANKTRANTRLKQTIQHNALFTPPKTLQQTVAALANQAAQESWLKKHSSLSAVLTLALHNNLTIQSSLQTAKATLARYDQVRFLDDTMAQYAAFANKPAASGFPFPSLLTLKGSIIDHAVEASRLQLLQNIQDVITQTRLAYYELQFAQQESRLVKKNSDLLDSLKIQMANNYTTHSTDLKQIIQIDINSEKQRNKRQQAQHRQQVQQARLNALLNLSSAFILGKLDRLTPIILSASAQKLSVKGQKHRVEIAQLNSAIKKMEQIIQLSERRFYPDLSANYSRFQNRTAKQVGSNAAEKTFAIRPTNTTKRSLFFGKDDAYLTETKQQYHALKIKRQALHRQTDDVIQQNFAQYSAQKRSHITYQSQIIPKSKTTVAIVNNQYETGASNYLNVIETQTLLLNARLLSLQAIKQMNSKATQLERLVGQTLEQ